MISMNIMEKMNVKREDKDILMVSIMESFEKDYSHFFADKDISVFNRRILNELVEDIATLAGSQLSYSELVEELEAMEHYSFRAIEVEFIHFAYPYIVDMEKVVAREDNVCNVKDNDSWKNHMNKALAQEIAKRQTYTMLGRVNNFAPVLHGFFYGQEIKKGSIPELIAAFNIKEDSWTEFQGTACYDDNKVGVSADLIFDNGMHYHGRIEESFGQLLINITND